MSLELQDYYAQLSARHVTPAWIGGGISIEPRASRWRWRDLRPQAMRAAKLVGIQQDKDVFTVPTWIFFEHVNSRDRPASLFSFSDAPVMKALSLYRDETRS